MSIITAEDIDRLAKASSKFSKMIKCAENGFFDENVPGSQVPGNQNATTGGTYPMNSASINNIPQQQNQIQQGPSDEYIAIPEEELANGETIEDTPEDIGARAAQSFLAPFFEAAMNGDSTAQDIIAKAASQIASSTAQTYSTSMQNGQMNEQDMYQNSDQNMSEELIANPEEEIASLVVPIKNGNPKNRKENGDSPVG